MKMQIICLRDIKANDHMAPMFIQNINAAIRDLRDMVNDNTRQEAWCRHPEDFELWHIGEWNSEDGTFYLETDSTSFQRKQLLAMSTLKAN